MTVNDYDGPVREYIRYCKRAAAELALKGSFLDPRYHPTPADACRLIFHGGDTGEAAKIRAAFREATEGPPGIRTGDADDNREAGVNGHG